MGTHEDAALGLPVGQDSDWAPCDRCGQSCVSFGDGLCIGCRMTPLKAANAEAEDAEPFDEMTGPMDTTPDLGRAMVNAVVQLTTNPHDGTTPGPAPCRTDAASLSDTQARRKACRVVEAAAYDALLASGLTMEQMVLLGAYNDSIHATRKAELDMHYTMFAKGGSL